ncbi:MAG: hypothetical protein ABW069_01335 [Duganella sp.]
MVSSEIVQTGIELADQRGPESAAAYLSGRGVLEPVINRVLSEPAQRRNMGRLRGRDDHDLAEEASRYKFKL